VACAAIISTAARAATGRATIIAAAAVPAVYAATAVAAIISTAVISPVYTTVVSTVVSPRVVPLRRRVARGDNRLVEFQLRFSATVVSVTGRAIVLTSAGTGREALPPAAIAG
jgi:hypothetical protein